MPQPGFFTWRDIDFETSTAQSCEEAWGTDNSRLTRYYLVPWELRIAARNALLGIVEVKTFNYSDQNGASLFQSYLSRTAPHGLTELVGEGSAIDLTNPDGKPWLFATGIPSIKGVGAVAAPEGIPRYDTALLQVNYEALPYEVLDDGDIFTQTALVDGTVITYPDEASLKRFVSFKMEDATKFVETRGFSWKWIDGPNQGTAVAQGFPLMIPGQLLKYTWWQVPLDVVPFGEWDNMHGTTNEAVFDQYLAETLIYVGYELDLKRMANGLRTVNVVHKVRYLPNGANALPDPRDNNQFHNVGSDPDPVTGETDEPHELDDFNKLFRIISS